MPRESLAGYPLVHRGKVRDTYDLGEHLLMVTSDRISAFDWVLPTPIPDRGKVLSSLSAWWFRRLGHVVPNHLVSDGVAGWPTQLAPVVSDLAGRAMIVRKAERLPYECVVRGYLSGTGWAEYRQHGTLGGEPLPSGLHEADELTAPRFTPAFKNDEGHDENMSYATLGSVAGDEVAARLRDVSLKLYEAGHLRAAEAGLILADTKFEFGWVDGELTLIDETLTPDSSRYWLAEEYAPGGSPPSLDKQYVRDWLLHSGWDRESPPPALPAEVVAATRERYLEAYRRITGEELPL